MALISSGILVIMWILGHDLSGHYDRLALISVDIISGVYCTYKRSPLRIRPSCMTFYSQCVGTA